MIRLTSLASILILLAACAGRQPAAPGHVAAESPSSPEHQSLAAIVHAEVEKRRQEREQAGVAQPEEAEEANVAAPPRRPPRVVPDVIENPPLNEHFLFTSPKAQLIVSDTVMVADDDEATSPLFDALGEQAKDQYVRAAFLNQAGYGTRALEHFYAAVERDPDNLWLKNRAARAALMANDLPRARRFAEEVLDADSKNYTGMLTLATLAQARDRRGEAKQWYEKVLEVKPRNIEALENLTRISYDERDMEKTKEYAARILAITSRNLTAILLHAEASALTGDIQHAARLYEQLVRYRPMMISRLSDMGIRLLRQGRLEDSRELFRRGVAMQPEAEVVRLQWEALLRETEGEEAVFEGYRSLVRDYPLDLRIHELYADYLKRRNRTDELVTQREAMLEMDPRHVPSLLSLGEVELTRGNFEDAKEYFEKAIRYGPEDASTLRDIAMVYLEHNEKERAQLLLEEALLIEPDDAQTHVALAMLQEETGQASEAEKNYKKALDLSPANERILRLLGAFYRKHGRLEEASQVLEQVLAVRPTDEGAQVELARLYFDLANAEALDRLQKSAPLVVDDKPTFYMHYGYVALEYGEWQRARWGLEHALEAVPEDLRTRQALAVVFLHLGEKQLAVETIEKGGQHLPEAAEARERYHIAVLQIHNLSREREKAVETAQRLVEENPDDLVLHEMLISALMEAERQEDAQQALNDAIRRFAIKQPVETQRLRAQVYRTQGDHDRAAGVLMPLLNEASDPHDVIFDLALTYAEKKDVERAERYYEHLIRELADKGDRTTTQTSVLVNAYNNLAYLYAVEGVNLEKAEEYASKALKLNPGADYILDTMGWVKFRQGNLEEAEKHLKRAEKLALPDPEIYDHLGDLHRAKDDHAAAIRYYEKALELDPKAERVREKLDALRPAVGAVAPAPSDS